MMHHLQEPMCLAMMEEKLDNFEYHRVQDFVDDFMLIVNNCRDFNGKDSGMLRHNGAVHYDWAQFASVWHVLHQCKFCQFSKYHML